MIIIYKLHSIELNDNSNKLVGFY